MITRGGNRGTSKKQVDHAKKKTDTAVVVAVLAAVVVVATAAPERCAVVRTIKNVLSSKVKVGVPQAAGLKICTQGGEFQFFGNLARFQLTDLGYLVLLPP